MRSIACWCDLQAAFATQRAFVADAAHELRSPLTAVRLQLQLLDRAPDEPARREARVRARRGGRARDPPGRAAADPGTQRAACTARAMLTAVALDAAAADARGRHPCAWRRAGARPAAWMRSRASWCAGRSRGAAGAGAQPGRQRRALYAAGRPGAGALPPAAPKRLVLEVIDTGPGIPAQERDRAFDRFYRRAMRPGRAAALGWPSSRRSPSGMARGVQLGDATGGGLQATRELSRVA